jgi:predicted amidohydrolase
LSISIQVTQTGQTTLTKTYTVDDADINRIVAAYQQDGNTAVNGNATRAQVLLTWANGLMENTKAKVVARELAVAQGAVVPPVPPVIT